MRESTRSWQKILAEGFSSASQLLDFLCLPQLLAEPLAEKEFKMRVPRRFAALMEKANPHDPLLRQVLPVHEETQQQNTYSLDPLQELATPTKGLLHKYPGRVLLTITGACAIHCRYCFRRHFPYSDHNPRRQKWQGVLDYIKQDDSIREVILSGGDPLLEKDSVLKFLLEQLSAITHVQIVRFHTRIPIVLPERINPSLLKIFAASRLQKVVVVHSNHPRELDETVAQACAQLKAVGCQLLNQSVILNGVNDEVGILAALSMRLFACGILPYYLHLLDKVEGAAHFDIPFEKALSLFRALQTQLPGYLVPRLTREEPGKESKTLYC